LSTFVFLCLPPQLCAYQQHSAVSQQYQLINRSSNSVAGDHTSQGRICQKSHKHITKI